MSPGSEARFRIRMEDGSEVPIASLEALARRIDRGEVLPDTELFDVGTGTWGPACESAVVRFILDERDHEGLEPLEEWEGAFDELEVEEGEEEEEGEEAGDPFDLGLTLEPGTFGKPAEDEEAEAGEVEADDAGEEAPTDFAGFTLDDDFGVRPEEEDEDGELAPSPAPPKEDPDALPDLVFPGDEGPRQDRPVDPGPQGGTDLEEWASEGPASPPASRSIPGEPMEGPRVSPVSRGKGTTRERPTPKVRTRPDAEPAPTPRRGAGKWVLLGLGVTGVAVVGVLILGDREAPVDESDARPPAEIGEMDPELAGAALVGGDLGGMAPVPRIPVGLEAPVERGLRAVTARFNVVVDSLRAVHGLPDQPPREWLSGPYLANASGFPGIRAFWEDYGTLVGELRLRDPELFLQTALRASREPDPERTRSVEAYLEERYRAVGPFRRERYAQLALVARRAVELHDFLETHEAEIRYTPAIGPEVPLDPVMEAQVERAEIRSDLLRHMDSLFQALDRSRGGGTPGLGGLGRDLFGRFGEG